MFPENLAYGSFKLRGFSKYMNIYERNQWNRKLQFSAFEADYKNTAIDVFLKFVIRDQ